MTRLRKSDFEFLLILALFLAATFQYINLYALDIAENSRFYFSPPRSLFLNLGYWRFLKDFIVLAIIALGSIKILIKMRMPFDYLLSILLLFSTVAIGAVMAAIGGKFEYFFPGLRWVSNLLAAYFSVYFFTTFQNKNLEGYFHVLLIVVKFTIAISLICACLQFWKHGELGGHRYYAFYANSGVYGFAIVGMASIIFVSRLKLLTHPSWYLALLVSAYFSGSRMAILCVAILLAGDFWIRYSDKLKLRAYYAPAYLVIVLLSLLIFIPVMDVWIGRGSLIDVQLESGRFLIFSANIDLLLDGGMLSVLFGHKFGFGTNAAFLLDIDGSKVLDNTLLSALVQVGIVGLFALLMSLVFMMRFVLASAKGATVSSPHSFVLIVVFVIAATSQNVLENYVLLPLIFVAYVVGSRWVKSYMSPSQERRVSKLIV